MLIKLIEKAKTKLTMIKMIKQKSGMNIVDRDNRVYKAYMSHKKLLKKLLSTQSSYQLYHLLFIISSIIFISSVLNAASPGTNAAQFLKLGTGARPISMGESFVAVADDANAVLWNPGGLAFLKQKEFTAMHLEYVENVRFSGISYVHPSKYWGTFAGNLSYLYVSDAEKTVLSDSRPEGFERKGEFGVSDRSAVVSYGRLVTGSIDGESKSLGIGINLRYLQETLDTFSASAFAVDFGALYKYNPRLRFGLALQNLGSKLKFVRESESLPLVLRLGAGGTEFDKRLNYSAEIFIPRDSGTEFHTGSEFWIMRIIAPRVGWRFRKFQRDNALNTVSGITAGFGFRLFNYQIDYGFVPFGEVGNSHRISLTGRF